MQQKKVSLNLNRLEHEAHLLFAELTDGQDVLANQEVEQG